MNPNELTEHIMKTAPQIEVDGETCYIVENDLLVPGSQLMAYSENVIGMLVPATRDAATVERLVVATLPDGRKMRWAPGTVLTWGFDTKSFEGHEDWLELAEKICAKAAEDWNAAAVSEGVEKEIRFAPVAPGEEPVFKYAYHPFPNDPGLLALAFFPNAARNERVVYIGPGTFSPHLPYDRVGIIRHELGHVLGFRHEHIRPEAQVGMTIAEKSRMEKWVTGGIGAEELTTFDGQSVMHYPLNGHGTLEFKLSDADITGFGKLYRMPSDSEMIEDFHV